MCHFVCLIKYRRTVLTEEIYITMKTICNQIEERYEIHFLEIGLEESRTFFDSECSIELSKENNRSSKKHNCKRNFQVTPRSQASIMGRKVLGK
jgi:REP-associated tyrosine transposase